MKKHTIFVSFSLLLYFLLISNTIARPFGMQTMTHINNAIKQQVRRAFIPVLKTKKEKIEYPKVMVFSKDYKSFAFLTEANYLSIWDMQQGKEYFNLPLKGINPSDIAINHSNNELFIIDQNNQLFKKIIYSEDTLQKFKPVSAIDKYQQIKSTNKTQVLSSGSKLIISPNVKNKKAFTHNIVSNIVSFDITSNAQSIVVATENKVFLFKLNNLTNIKQIKQWNISSPISQVIIDDLTKSIAIKFNTSMFSSGGYALITKSGNYAAPKLYNDSIINFGFTNTKQLAVYTKNQQIYYRNLSQGNIQRKFSVEHFKTNLAQFPSSNKFVFLPVRNKGIYLINTQSGKKQAQLVSTKNGWAVVDNSGRYDGNEEALSDVSWEINGEMFELDRFSKRYFEPGLLAKIVYNHTPKKLAKNSKPLKQKKMMTKPENKLEEGVYLPPVVSLNITSSAHNHKSSQKVNISVMAKTSDKNNTIKSLKFFHNGKRLNNKRIISSKDKNSKSITWKLKIKPIVGKNTFLAEVGGWGGIYGQSKPQTFLVKATAKPKSKSKIIQSKKSTYTSSRKAKVYIKSVGIDEYKGKELALNFAVADATDIYKVISDYEDSLNRKAVKNRKTVKKGKAVKNVANKDSSIKTLLLNNNASKKKILSMLDEIKKTATANDTLFLFMSGHGQVVDNKWYFLPQEANTLLKSSHVKKVGLSSQELSDKLVSIPNQKIVLIVDACQSGAATEDFNNFQQRRDLNGLSKDAGIHILAATRADQLAPEYSQLGHGIFTYILLNGLRKNKKGYYNADRWPKDGKVMISELKKYTKKFVPIMISVLERRRVKEVASRGVANQRSVVTPVGSSIGKDFQLF